MNTATEAIRIFEQALNSTFSEFDFKRDAGEKGLFPRIYRRTLIGGVGVFVDVCISREGFSPAYPGQLPPNPTFEGWAGVYLANQPNLGRRFYLFSCKKPADMTYKEGLEIGQKVRNLIMIWNYDKIAKEEPKFNADFIIT